MIVKHPSLPGWLIATSEIMRLIDAPHRLIMPDGAIIHPLHLTPSDFGPDDTNPARQYALAYLNTWRATRRSAAALTESMYYEAQRWQVAPDTPFGLNSQRGRMSQEQYAAWVIKTWTKIEADYSLAVSLVKQSRTVEEIELILSRRI